MNNNSKILKNYSYKSTTFSRFLNNANSLKEIISLFNRRLTRNIYFRKWFSWESRFQYRGLSVFVARNNSIELGLIDKICNLIENYGFVIINT